MKAEHCSSLFENSLLLKKCLTTTDVEIEYNIGVVGPPRDLNLDEIFVVFGEWDNVARYAMDSVTILK